MSNGYYNDYSGDLDRNGGQEESGSGLRALLEQALGKINDLQGELQDLKKAGQPSVDSLLESKGIDPAVAQIIPEGANPAEWLDQHGHLFAKQGENLDGDSGELPTPEDDGYMDPDLLAEQEAWEAAHGVSSGTPRKSLDPMKQLEEADTPEKVMALIEQATKALPGD